MIGKLRNYSIDQKQGGYLNNLRVDINGATYTRKNRKTGDSDTESDDWGPEYLVIPQVMNFAQANWDALMNGDTVPFRLAILEKLQSYGFKFFKSEETTMDGREVVVLKLKPSSFFISLVMSPFKLYIDKKEKKLLRITGTSLPKLQPGPSDFRAIEGDMVYLD